MLSYIIIWTNLVLYIYICTWLCDKRRSYISTVKRQCIHSELNPLFVAVNALTRKGSWSVQLQITYSGMTPTKECEESIYN